MVYTAAAKMGSLVTLLTPHRPGVIVLIYHSISEADDVITVPPALFQEQVLWLRDHYRIVSLDAALKEQHDEDVVVLTFDDGYTDYQTNAVPYLVKHNLPSTVYAITEYVLDPEKPFTFASGAGKKSMSRVDLEGLSKEPLVTIGSHTHTHRRLVKVDEADLHQELEQSYVILSDILGRPDLHFCYPWGVYDDAADRAVRRQFTSATTGIGGKNPHGFDSYLIKRTPVKRESLDLFAHRVRGHMVIESTARAFRDRMRSAALKQNHL